MKFRNIPAHYWNEDIEIWPYGDLCPLLQPCDRCGFYYPCYFLCTSGHVICPKCEAKSETPTVQNSCSTCRLPSCKVVVPIDLIINMDFCCGCGVVGILLELKTHLESSEYTQACDIEPEPEDQLMVIHERDFKHLEMIFTGMRSNIQTRLEKVRGIVEHFGIELVPGKSIPKIKKKIEAFDAETLELLERYRTLKGINDQIRPIVDIVRTPAIHKTFSIENVMRGRDETVYIETSTMRIFLTLTLNKTGNADLKVSGCVRNTSRSPTNMIEKCVVIRHHDQNGYTLKEVSVKPFPNGVFHCNVAAEGSQKQRQVVEQRQITDFIDCVQLFGPAVLLSDLIHISARLHA
ncbi:uncharacterized protein LOC100905061 [Galendromus occidentalis]|uniref:Uncharacterized protein LOC100905061 n=1 Tax=Galendromus occidentalis TaxID=34638 RepID=A0AAJ6QWY0_9ACAR|nr:uncharacterized protein LOC100905061 [Galendromus occidentalis]